MMRRLHHMPPQAAAELPTKAPSVDLYRVIGVAAGSEVFRTEFALRNLLMATRLLMTEAEVQYDQGERGRLFDALERYLEIKPNSGEVRRG